MVEIKKVGEQKQLVFEGVVGEGAEPAVAGTGESSPGGK